MSIRQTIMLYEAEVRRANKLMKLYGSGHPDLAASITRAKELLKIITDFDKTVFRNTGTKPE